MHATCLSNFVLVPHTYAYTHQPHLLAGVLWCLCVGTSERHQGIYKPARSRAVITHVTKISLFHKVNVGEAGSTAGRTYKNTD